ncbi:aquaporin-like [Zeugodacus cucurbitae]|uniref:aquaporin-like n=1 Tax=Zeugodacus cucurbitae TaxID=28588 RepID=UPI000596A2F7|nr:aquaporin-like [Zeugodacus cucurbitae]
MMNWERFFGASDWNVDFIRALFAEFLGTFFFVLIGILCTLFKPSDTEWPYASPVQVAFALGCTAFSVSHSLGPISGAHISPTVSLGMFLVCGMSLLCFIGYVIAQTLGGLAATAVILSVIDKEMYQDNRPLRASMSSSLLELCIVECLAAFIWIIVAIVAMERRNEDAFGNGSFTIGFTVLCSYLIALLLTGGGVNPVRSLSASIIVNEWDYHYCYWIGSITGACLAALIYYCCSGVLRNRRVYRITGFPT